MAVNQDDNQTNVTRSSVRSVSYFSMNLFFVEGCHLHSTRTTIRQQSDRPTDVHVEREEPLCDDPRSGQCAVEGGVLGEGCRFGHDGRVPEDGDEERDEDLTEEEDGRLEVW